MFKKIMSQLRYVFMATIMAASLLGAAIPKAEAAPFTKSAKVSFTFDDGHASDILAAQTLATNGFSATTYIITDCIGMTTAPNACESGPDYKYMTWDQVAELHNTYGWEIGSHTASHPSLTDIPIADVTRELRDSKGVLASKGYDATSLAFPYGHYNNAVLTEGAKFYTSQRRFEDSGTNMYPYNDQLVMIKGVQAGISVDRVKGYVDEAIANGYWLVLVFHEISEAASTDPDDFEYTPGELDQVADYIKLKEVPVVNMSEGIVESHTNLFANGSFDAGISGGWTTDDPTRIIADANNHGSYPNPQHSISLTAQPVAGNKHLFSPCVVVDPAETYVFKNYLNVTAITSGEVSFYVDEYSADSCGDANWISGAYKPGVAYASGANALLVKNVNFTHKPSAATKAIRLEVIVTGNSGIKAYLDNAQMFPESAIGGSVPPAPTVKPGDANNDTFVDELDLSLVLSNWGQDGRTRAQGNLNGDSFVDELDLSVVLNNWGT